MAAATGFKQQCPSCEAMVPIKDPSFIGRKIDCPKCKYRFVVEDPGADEDTEDQVEEFKSVVEDKDCHAGQEHQLYTHLTEVKNIMFGETNPYVRAISRSVRKG